MKNIKSITAAFLLIIPILCSTSCSAKKDTIIIDCKTDKVVAELSMNDNPTEVAALTDALNKTEETSEQFETKEKYLVHFVDPKDSAYDIWYYVYISEDNRIFVQYDTDKLSDVYDGFMDGNMQKCTTMTFNVFNAVLSTGKVG